MAENKKNRKTSIGGQAVLEGVMMRGRTSVATAVRDQDGEIRLEAERLHPSKAAKVASKIPFVRGAISFFVSLVTGTKILMRSAEVYGETTEEPSKFEKWLSKTFKVDVMNIALFFGVVLGLAFSIGLFFVVPDLLGRVLVKYTPEFPHKELCRNLFEGVLRILIFVGYILLTSLMKDIRRTYMYHGAEHKTITCYEKGLDLTVDNVRACRRVHDRCGTTFMFIVMVISILVFSVVSIWLPPKMNGAVKLLCKLALLPVVAGISYEILKLLAKTDSPLVYPLKAPGLLLQRITTREPDDGMIEVAITSFNKVLKMDADETEPECKFVFPEKVVDVTKRIKEEFKAAGIEDEADAEWLVSCVSGVKRSELSDRNISVSGGKIDKINALAKERESGRPLWYVLGTCDFYGYEFKVDERALIPRPETEELVETAIGLLTADDCVLDLCTGSGCIAISVKLKTNASVTASDVSEDALSLARENAAALKADVNFIKSDLFENIDGKFSMIITNPPYIKSEDIERLQTEVKDFEPKIALDGGEDGLDFYRKIAAQSKPRLFDSGVVLAEIGAEQGEAVKDLFEENGFTAKVFKDISGNDRVVAAVKI